MRGSLRLMGSFSRGLPLKENRREVLPFDSSQRARLAYRVYKTISTVIQLGRDIAISHAAS